MRSRKKFLGLIPLLVIAAFAIMPGAAQAVAPHLFEDGVEIGQPPFEGKQPLLGWGKLKLTNIEIGKVTCENAFGGRAENPVGGAAGRGEVMGFTVYNCVSESCEAVGHKAIEIGPLGEGENLKSEAVTVEHITTPWEAVVEEKPASSGKFHLKVGNKTLKSPTQIRFYVNCFAKAVHIEFTGQLAPLVVPGTLIGSAPSKVEFEEGGETGELESLLGPGKVKGPVNTFGYNGGDLITVKNS